MNFFKRFVIVRTRRVKQGVRRRRVAGRRKASRTRPTAASQRAHIEHKNDVKKLIMERLEFYNASYGYKYGRVTIKNQSSRWGSCSSKGNINFNYRLKFLSEKLRDYVIVHELCHLGQLNHSQAFWDLVARTMPDYRELRAELHKIRLATLDADVTK